MYNKNDALRLRYFLEGTQKSDKGQNKTTLFSKFGFTSAETSILANSPGSSDSATHWTRKIIINYLHAPVTYFQPMFLFKGTFLGLRHCETWQLPRINFKRKSFFFVWDLSGISLLEMKIISLGIFLDDVF